MLISIIKPIHFSQMSENQFNIGRGKSQLFTKRQKIEEIIITEPNIGSNQQNELFDFESDEDDGHEVGVGFEELDVEDLFEFSPPELFSDIYLPEEKKEPIVETGELLFEVYIQGAILLQGGLAQVFMCYFIIFHY